jgi:hypothetical protein
LDRFTNRIRESVILPTGAMVSSVVLSFTITIS